jgi:uncharacterized membrane protein YbhN (UPF0104 family)
MRQFGNGQGAPDSPPPKAPTFSWPRFGPWLLGLLILSGVIVAVTSFSEIEGFVQLLRRADPVWLVAGIILQIATYFSTAAIWLLTLRKGGTRYSILTLVPLGVAKLFSEQALPSGGMSGMAFFVAALNRRGVPAQICTATLLVSLVSYYLSYFMAAALSLALLRFYHATSAWIVIVTALFCAVAVVIPVGALWLHCLSRRSLPSALTRVPGLSRLLAAIGGAPTCLLRDATLLFQTTLFQASIFLLDAATLWAMLRAIGQDVSFLLAFPSFIVASMVASLGLIPLGLGTFEATCIAMLRSLGVPLESALTATLLLRGLTLWAPMAPGLWLARRELSSKARAGAEFK